MDKKYDTEIPNNEHYSLEEYEEMVSLYRDEIFMLKNTKLGLQLDIENLINQEKIKSNAMRKFDEYSDKLAELSNLPKWKKWLLGIKF